MAGLSRRKWRDALAGMKQCSARADDRNVDRDTDQGSALHISSAVWQQHITTAMLVGWPHLSPPRLFSSLSASSLKDGGMATALASLQRAYPRLYAKIYLHNMPFTVRPLDYIWTHRMRDVKPGDVLRLSRITEIGSADATWRGHPWIRYKGVEVTATVMEHSRGTKVSAKEHLQRKGRRPKRTIKPCTTLLRIQDIRINRTCKSE